MVPGSPEPLVTHCQAQNQLRTITSLTRYRRSAAQHPPRPLRFLAAASCHRSASTLSALASRSLSPVGGRGSWFNTVPHHFAHLPPDPAPGLQPARLRERCGAPRAPRSRSSTKARILSAIPFCGKGSGSAEPRALMRGYVCLVPLAVGWAATMTRASPTSQPQGRISREPVPSAADNELSDNWRRLCLHPSLARGTQGPSGRSNRKFSGERKRLFVLERLNFHCHAQSC